RSAVLDFDALRVTRDRGITKLPARRQVVLVLHHHRREAGDALAELVAIEALAVDDVLGAGRDRDARDAVALALLVVEADRRHLERADLARGLDRGVHDLLEGERAAKERRGVVKALVLVLRPLDGGEDALRLDGAEDLVDGTEEERLVARGERPGGAAIGAKDAAQVTVLEHRDAEERADLLG